MKNSLALSLSDVLFILLINVKMPVIVGILTFMSRINYVLSRGEYEKSFITWARLKDLTNTELTINSSLPALLLLKFSALTFQKILSGIPSECQTVWDPDQALSKENKQQQNN